MSTTLRFAALVAVLALTPAYAQYTDELVRIGVLTDLSGIYADLSGPGSVLAAQMAVQDAGGRVNGRPIEAVSGDTLNKPDVGATIARRWFDTDKVDVVVDLVPTTVALAVSQLAHEKNKLALVVGSAVTALTNEQCTPTNVHWMYDSYAQAVGTAASIARAGGDSWFFITMDNVAGKTIEQDATRALAAANARIVGSIKHPFPGTDFSSFVVAAQRSKAKVIAIANAGTDATGTIKQAVEFRVLCDLRPRTLKVGSRLRSVG